MAQQFYARRPFGYDDLDLDVGQIIELHGCVNDEKLIRLNYLCQIPARTTPMPCRYCGESFIGLQYLNGHGHKRHSGREFTDIQKEDRLEEELQTLETSMPLHVDKAAANYGPVPKKRGRPKGSRNRTHAEA